MSHTVTFDARGRCGLCERHGIGLKIGPTNGALVLVCERCADELVRWSRVPGSGVCRICGEQGGGVYQRGRIVCYGCRDALTGRIGITASKEVSK